jgi:N-acetylglucosaminyldiphosphoundecaprenol N-acetyl-beta-D-mannosaminyltransferase
MIKKIYFKDIVFNNFKYDDFEKIISKKGLFIFPSGPGLSTLEEEIEYHNSLKEADFVFFDSGYFVLLLRIFKSIKVNKYSGYKFLEKLFRYLKKNNDKSIFCIDPNYKFSKSNKIYLQKLGVKKIYNYVAPKYDPKNLSDKQLLQKIIKAKPSFIMNNIGGGTQEILGHYIKKNLKFRVNIFCTGGAISFFTGDRAPINNLIDKLYLGWFIRIIFNPFIFIKRYFYALKLLPMVLMNNVKTKSY